MNEINPADLPPDERAGWLLDHARGLTAGVAAVRILTATRKWVLNDEFAAACLGAELGVDGEVRMWVDWEAAAAWIEEHPASDSEIALARLAVAVADGGAVDLGDVLPGLDQPTAQTVLGALAHLAGAEDLDAHISAWTPPDPTVPPGWTSRDGRWRKQP